MMKTLHTPDFGDLCSYAEAPHALAAAVAGLAGYAAAGCRVHRFVLEPRRTGWGVSAEITIPKRGSLEPIEGITQRASFYAPAMLLREHTRGVGWMNDADGPYRALGDYPTYAEGLEREMLLRVQAWALTMIAGPLLAGFLKHCDRDIDFIPDHEHIFSQKYGPDGLAFELFEGLDALTNAAKPESTPTENLLRTIEAFDGESVTLIPSRMEVPEDDEILASKSILQEISLMGALLPKRFDPKTFTSHPSLEELQRRRERAQARHSEILAGGDLNDDDLAFLLTFTPDIPWFAVLLGTTSGTGQQAMRVLYAGFLAFWESRLITRGMDWAGDPMMQGDDAPLPITECINAWTGYRDARWMPCHASN